MGQENKTEYWGEIPLEEMKRLNDTAEEIGWQKAIVQLLNKDLQQTLLDGRRADWKYLAPLDVSAAEVLDIGSGLGAVSFSLTKTCRKVYALEPVPERLRFIEIRARQDGIRNIEPVCANASRLPFPDRSFDLVVVNGVLEWVGFFNQEEAPDKTQEKVLREVARVLKPDGIMYLAIENRFAFQHILGARDPHTGLRFINLMPRPIADLYHRALKKRRYTTYLYSGPGYARLLQKTGFQNTRFYAPLPSYRHFTQIFPLEALDVTMKFWIQKMIDAKALEAGPLGVFLTLVVFLLNTPLKHPLKLFVPDYGIFATKGSFRNDLSDAAMPASKNERHLFYHHGWRKKTILSFPAHASWPSSLLLIAEDPAAEVWLKNASQVISEIIRQAPDLADLLPHGMRPVSILGESGWVKSVREGGLLAECLLKHRRSLLEIDNILSVATGHLIALALKTRCPRTARLEEIAAKNLETLAADAGLDKEKKERLDQQIAKVLSGASREPLPDIVQHGDLQPNNIICRCGPCAKLTFIDWEYASMQGLPLIDLLHLLFMSVFYVKFRAKTEKQRFFQPLFALGQPLRMIDGKIFEDCFYKKNAASDLIAKHVDRYSRALNLSAASRHALFLLYVLRHLSFNETFLSLSLEKGRPLNI